MNARTLFALLALGAVGCAAQSTESAAALAASVDSTARQTFLPVVLVPSSVEVIQVHYFDPKVPDQTGVKFITATKEYAELNTHEVATIGVASRKGVKATLLDYKTGDPMPAISDTVRYVFITTLGVAKKYQAITAREDCAEGMFCINLDVEPEK